MPSEKVKMALRSKTDMAVDDIEKLSEKQAWDIIYSLPKQTSKDSRMQICFTGFGKSEKQELIECAQNCGLRVVASVTKNLTLLVTGDNTGPAKMKRAEDQGVKCVTKEQFLKSYKGLI